MTILIPPATLPPDRNRTPDSPEDIRTWLAGGRHAPARIREEWSGPGRLAVIECGPGFAAIRIPGAIFHAAAGGDDTEAVSRLATRLQGPVIHDQRNVGPTYYAVTAWYPGVYWRAPADTPMLGPGTFLGVPDIDRTSPPGSYWVRPPRYTKDFCERAAVFDLIMRGRRALQLTDEELGDADHAED